MATLSMPKTQREQLMVLLAVLGIAAAGLYWYLKYSPTSAALDTRQAQIDSLNRVNDRLKRQLAGGTVNELRQQAQMYAENLTLMRRLVPAGNEVPSLIDQISTSARREGLDVGEIQPLGPEIGTDFDAYRYKLRVNGTYHTIAAFLANVGSLPRIVVPVNLAMTVAQPNPLGRTASTSIELHTYVAHTAPPK
jgi:type IV pilus assembly protein PilO